MGGYLGTGNAGAGDPAVPNGILLEMTRSFLLVLFGALLGASLVGLGLGLGAREEARSPARVSPSPAPPPELIAEIEGLRRELAHERARNLAKGDGSAARPSAPVAPRVAEAPVDSAEPSLEADPTAGPEAESGIPWFDASALEREGWTAGEVRRIRLRWEEYELAKLEVENQRARKVPGWKELGKRSLKIETDVRRDLGEEGYEAMRFAANQPNRVVLTELLETSPAARVGLAPGDEVISYDGQRIFTPSALQLLTQGGAPGALTEIRVLRAGEERRFFLPRGPLGTRLEASVRPPYR